MIDNEHFIDWVVDNYSQEIPYFQDWLETAINEPNSSERETLEYFYELYNMGG